MTTKPNPLHQRLYGVVGALFVVVCIGCSHLKLPGKKMAEADPQEKTEKPKDEVTNVDAPGKTTEPSVDLGFLLTMNFAEAKAISTQSLELPMGVRVAADSIEVVKLDKENNPKRIRAKGKVYIESGEGQDSSKALCQEALISFDEIILRGKPILQRGGSIVEGLDDKTVAYMLGSRLRVIGLHRLTNQDTMVAMGPDLGPWAAGPNLLLPALAEDSVPNNIREEMLKAAEAEAVLQYNRSEALTQPEAAPAPWIKGAESPAKKAAVEKGNAAEKPVPSSSTSGKSGLRKAA